MGKILIATKNKDKYKIVSRLLETTIFPNSQFYSLSDINTKIDDKAESGSIESRSFEKAASAYIGIQDNSYDYIIGLDDGIKIKDILYEDVKKLNQQILNNELLSEGEIIYMVRAYTFFNPYGESYTTSIEIPYKYKKLDHELTPEENTYPLNHVLTSINSDKSIAKQDSEESNLYFQYYSQEKFEEIKKYFRIGSKKR